MFYKYKIYFFVSLFLLISTPAFAELLWPFETGTVFEYRISDNRGFYWTEKVEVLEEVTLDSKKYFRIRIWDNEPEEEIEIQERFARTTENAIYTWTENGEELPFQIAPVGTKWSYGDTVSEMIAIEPVTVPYGGPYTAYVHRKYNSAENSPYRYEYMIQGFGWVKTIDYWSDYPPHVMELTKVIHNNVAEIIGIWSNGIWYWDMAASNWTKMTFNTPDGDITAGDFTGDGKADVASCWNNGLWYQDGATLIWTKVSGTAPDRMTAGDITGDGRSEIIGTWSNGIWYWDEAKSEWTKMAASTPTGDIAAGDFTGDGKADVASCWDSGLWYQNGATHDWTKVSDSAPDRLTAGDVTGK